MDFFFVWQQTSVVVDAGWHVSCQTKERVRTESRPGTYSHILTGVDDIKLDDVIDITLQEREDPYQNRIDKYSSSEVWFIVIRLSLKYEDYGR